MRIGGGGIDFFWDRSRANRHQGCDSSVRVGNGGYCELVLFDEDAQSKVRFKYPSVILSDLTTLSISPAL